MRNTEKSGMYLISPPWCPDYQMRNNVAFQKLVKHLNFFNVSLFFKFYKMPICNSVFFQLELDWRPHLRIWKKYWKHPNCSDINYVLKSPQNNVNSKTKARCGQGFSTAPEQVIVEFISVTTVQKTKSIQLTLSEFDLSSWHCKK